MLSDLAERSLTLTLHPSLTESRIVRAVKRNAVASMNYIGFCIACGRKAKQSCEPDARGYPCDYKSCGKLTVYAAEELLLELVFSRRPLYKEGPA